MSTFLFDRMVFGPVESRRLGISLGINLLPNDRKVCTFNCIYCECGWTESGRDFTGFQDRHQVRQGLEQRLRELQDEGTPVDTITFAGNGEPTLHSHFDLIIQDTLALRNHICPRARIAVLSNASLIQRPKVFNALKQVDMNILKLDSAFSETVMHLNQPRGQVPLAELIEHLKAFKGSLTIQTLFVRARYNGHILDNTSPREVDAWIDAVQAIAPQQVMIYTIARGTPLEQVEAVGYDDLQDIAGRLFSQTGIPAQISD